MTERNTRELNGRGDPQAMSQGECTTCGSGMGCHYHDMEALSARVKELLESRQHEFECFQKVNSALTEARLENARLRKVAEVLREFVSICDSAPPVELMKRIGKCCGKAKKALRAWDGG